MITRLEWLPGPNSFVKHRDTPPSSQSHHQHHHTDDGRLGHRKERRPRRNLCALAANSNSVDILVFSAGPYPHDGASMGADSPCFCCIFCSTWRHSPTSTARQDTVARHDLVGRILKSFGMETIKERLNANTEKLGRGCDCFSFDNGHNHIQLNCSNLSLI